MAIKAVLAAVAAATAVIGGVMAARSYRRSAGVEMQVGEFNQKAAERDAKIAETAARESQQTALMQAMSDAREFRNLQASTELALQHHGWQQQDGTPIAQLAYNADQFEQQQAANLRSAVTDERNFLDRAVQDRMRGDLEMLVARNNAAALQTKAATSLLGGITGAAKVYMGTRIG
ncbi:hypothetical protein CMI37_10115 [Candidatus Pacearchaeota archaeon]|nr:hypothetical protein [Candidatus Pacearchaeota archaeon]